jgi:aspartyl-tRNA(Asn)/glutamyl-tRNA(Gln) amidotransferase subunit A
LSFSLDTIGPLTRTVADNALMLRLLAGADPRDPTAALEAVPDYVAAAKPGSLRGLRLAVPRAFFWDKMSKPIGTVLEAAIMTFSKLGAKIIEVTPPDMNQITAAANVVVSSEAAAIHGPWLKTRPQLYSEALRARLEIGLALSAVDYIDALRWRSAAIASWLSATRDADAVFTPVVAAPTPTIVETDLAGRPEAMMLIASLTRLVRPINYLGLPGLTVPAGFVRGGMPVGFQLVGQPFGEATLYRFAGAFEAKIPVHEVVPD